MKKNCLKYSVRSASGQSIIELLIGVVIITMVLTAISLLASRSVQLSQMALLRQKAVTIAREGIERVRMKRDTLGWSDFLSSTYDSPADTVADSRFTRLITVTDNNDPSDPKATVKVVVEWTDVKGDHFITQQTILSDW